MEPSGFRGGVHDVLSQEGRVRRADLKLTQHALRIGFNDLVENRAQERDPGDI